jgi:hypothetical protein
VTARGWEYALAVAAAAAGSTRPEAELHHIRMHTIKPPFAESVRLYVVKLTDNPG